MMKRTLLALFFTLTIPTLAAVSVTAAGAYPYGFLVETGSQRTPIVQVTGGTTNLVNITVSSGLTLVSTCTTGCPAYATFKVTSAGGTITTTGSFGSFALHSTDEQTITFTSTEDATKSFTFPVHVASVTGNDFVDVEPTYNQAFKGQLKMLQSYVVGHPGAEDVTWHITQASGGNGVLIDTACDGNTTTSGCMRDTYFSATVSGLYTITATSVANGSIAASAKIWVSANPLPRTTSPNKTEPTECDSTDPTFSSGTKYAVTTVAGFRAINLLTTAAPIFVSIANIDTTGIAPTTYPVSTSIESTGTATQPVYICGIADSAGNLPVVEGNLAQENTNTPTSGLFIDGAGAFKTTIISSHFGEGYELGSVGMNYISFTGLKIHGFHAGNTYFAANGTSTPYCCNASSGIWTRAGQHIHMEGLDLDYNDIGALINNNTSGTGRTYSDFIQMIGNHIHNFGDTGSLQSSTHGAYIQGLHAIFEGNLVDHPVVGMGGDGVKMRSDSSIIRYNTIRGPVEHIIEYPDQEDAWQFVDWNSMLGQPGVGSCGTSTCYGTTTNNITFPHITENAEAMSKDYFYGNNASNEYGSIGQSGLQYGSYSALQECLNNQSAWCTPGIDRNGQLYAWSNNFDQNIGFGGGNEGGVISTTNYNSGGFVGAAMPIQPTVFLANSVMWSDTVTPYPWTINADQAMIATIQTNMTAAGSLGCTGTITGGTTAGWSGYTNAFTYTNSNPIQTHITGLGGTNCLTTTQQPPYNLATFAPIAGSSLISAASSITNNEIHHMPVRFRPDPENGYIVARTDSASTIGAMDAGNLPALSSFSVYPNVINVSSGFGQIFLTAQSNWADGITRVTGAQGNNWVSSNGSAVTCFGPTNPVCNVIANGSGTISATYPPYGTGLVSSTNFTIGGAATASNPQFTPSTGTFSKTQLIYLYSNVANTSATNYLCYTTDGTTPTGSGSSCTHGSMFVGGIPIAATTTIKAVACSSTQACSSVISSTYTITGGSPTLVSMALTPTSLSFIVGGANQTLTCTATMSDSSTPACSSVGTVTWLSGTPSHATVNSSGVVSPVAAGTSNITASIGAVTSNIVVATVTSGFNVNNTMSQATIQSIINSADTTTGNTVTFAAGGYPGANVGGLQWACANGTIYTGPANSAGFGPGSNNQWGPITTNSPAVLNSDNNVSGSGSITSIQGGNSGHTTPGSGCTIQNLTFANDSALVAGGDWASNNPSYGILFQNNTIQSLTNNGNGSTGLFFHNVTGYTIQNNYVTGATGAYSGTGGFGIAQSDTNGLITNNFCGTIGQCFGSGFDGATGFTNVTITNNICKDIARICIEFTNGNSPGIATGLTFTGNLYINPTGDPFISPFSGAVSMATGNFSNPGSSGFTYHITDNVFAANTSFNTSGGNHMFYCEELTSGSASTAIRNLCQGNWPAAPAVAVGNVTGSLDISNTIAQGSFLTSLGAAIGCEYSGSLPNCGFSSGGTIPGPITFASLTSGTTPLQQTSTTPAISPASGAFASPPTVTFSNTQPNVSYFYTTNGTTPTTASTLYTSSFTCSSLPCTVKVISQWGVGGTTAYSFPAGYGYAPSAVATNTFTLAGGTVATPTFSPVAGTYGPPQSVAITTSTGAATICYTTNGVAPTATTAGTCDGGSSTYTTPVSVPASLTLKAIGTKASSTNSAVATAAYVITSSPPTGTTGTVIINGTVNF